MADYAYRPFYRRNLPHMQPPGATVFVTFRLAGSLPRAVVERWMAERQRTEAAHPNAPDVRERALKAFRRAWFARFEDSLDRAEAGPDWLKDQRIAALVAAAIRRLDGARYTLDAYCVMPNHVHVVFTPRQFVAQVSNLRHGEPPYHSLAAIMHSLKRYTARAANRLLARSGTFWEHESFDHFVRDENELGRVVRYVLNNPVKAGLATRWQDWPWSYSRYGTE